MTVARAGAMTDIIVGPLMMIGSVETANGGMNMTEFRAWMNEPATEKQLAYILEMQEFSEFPLPKFEGKTKGEAAEYIDKHIKEAHTSTWGIEHGY